MSVCVDLRDHVGDELSVAAVGNVPAEDAALFVVGVRIAVEGLDHPDLLEVLLIALAVADLVGAVLTLTKS
jgi:hypothetical protein